MGSSSKPSVFVALLVSSASICVQRQTPSGFVTSGKRQRKNKTTSKNAYPLTVKEQLEKLKTNSILNVTIELTRRHKNIGN